MSQQASSIELQYVSRLDVAEVFADVLEKLTVDGGTGTLRMEFCVTRMDDPVAGQAKQTGKKVTAARVVMPMPGFLDLLNKFQQVAAVMEQQGMLKRQPVQTITVPPADKLN